MIRWRWHIYHLSPANECAALPTRIHVNVRYSLRYSSRAFRILEILNVKNLSLVFLFIAKDGENEKKNISRLLQHIVECYARPNRTWFVCRIFHMSQQIKFYMRSGSTHASIVYTEMATFVMDVLVFHVLLVGMRERQTALDNCIYIALRSRFIQFASKVVIAALCCYFIHSFRIAESMMIWCVAC